MKKRILSLLLALCMILSMAPMPVHVHAAEEESIPVCNCGTDDPAIHATTCSVYVAPEDPLCCCAEKCTEVNIWCDVCGFDYARCGGTDTAVVYADAVSYIERAWDGTQVVSQTKTVTNYTVVTGSTTTMQDGWYVVNSDVTVSSRITVSGTVNLILVDGYTLTASQGVQVMDENTLNIYGQSADSGAIRATGKKYEAGIGGHATMSLTYNSGTTVIHGGSVTASGGENGSGIGGGDDSTTIIYGGVIEATGGSNRAAGIGGSTTNDAAFSGQASGDIDIYGGIIFAAGKYGADDIGAGDGSKGKGAKDVTILGGLIFDRNGNGTMGGTSYTLEKSWELPSGKTLTIESGKTLIIPKGVILTTTGTLVNNGTIVTDCKASYDEQYSHTPAENAGYTDNGDGTHSYTCTVCGPVTEDHTGGTATCTTQANCEHCGASYGEVDTTNHDSTVAFDSNGFCPNGCYEPATDSNSDGIYEIGNAGQLYWFAAQVNGGEKSINAVLMNDIDLTNHTWTPIGVTAMGEGVTDGYTGTFDGQGHVISNITFATPTSAMAAGIFGTVQSGGTVKNLGVENLTFDNNDYDHRAAGIGGQLLAGSTISDCYVINSTVKASSRVVGGIVGMNKGTVKNCYTYNMTLAAYNNRFGGISGDYSGGKLENCYTDYSALASSQAGTATNCEAGVSAERFASGEVAYLLNGDQSEIVFKQTIGTDATPNFTGGTVYQVSVTCKEGAVAYANTQGDLTHHYVNGICTACGGYEPATDSDSDGYYEIANAGQLYWFAAQVNSGSTAINGELTADIKVNENVLTADGTLNGDGSNFRVWTPIGNNSYPYIGEFRGNKHTVSGLYFNGGADYVGLFGYVGSGNTEQVSSVQNVGVIDSYLNGGSYVGGVVGYNDIGGTVQYVYNTGNIKGSSCVGGVVGRNQYIVRYAYNTGTVYSQSKAGGVTGENNYILEYAYNTGSASDWFQYGSVTGYNRDATKLKNCYYLADSETDELDGTTAKTAEQFERGEVAYLLGAPFGQNIDNGESVQTLPVLSDATVYAVQNCKNETFYSNTNKSVGHIGGTATCTAQAVCTVCGASYGELVAHSTTAEGDIAADCNSKAYCSVCESYYGEVDKTNHDETVAYVNGFCPSGCYEPAVLNGDVYEITNAGQLYWFAGLVNGTLAGVPQNNAANAVLTADITVNEDLFSKITIADDRTATVNEGQSVREWIPIGAWGDNYSPQAIKAKFMGTFDGQGHTVSGLYFNNAAINDISLFGDLRGVVKNVNTADCYFYGNENVGGVVGYMGRGSLVESCENISSLASGAGAKFGGIAGTMYGLHSSAEDGPTMRYCINHADVIGNSNVGGLVGYMHDSYISCSYNEGNVRAFGDGAAGLVGYNEYSSTIEYSYNNGKVEAETNAFALINNESDSSSVLYCYNNADVCPADLSPYHLVSSEYVGSVSSAQFASGEVAFWLQLGLGKQIWGQNIDNGNTVQTAPVLHGAEVYRIYNCKREYEYSNTSKKDGHRYENGTCTVCGAYEPAVLKDGVYQISNAAQLYWFAQQVNSGKTAINGELTTDIVVNEGTMTAETTGARAWTPIGSSDNVYTGTFNGGSHTISGLYVNNSSGLVGLFGVNKGTVQNVGIEDSYFNGHTAVGSVVGYNSGGTVKNCYNTGNVSGSIMYVGGLVGSNEGTVTDCYNTGNVSCDNSVGGVVGYNEGTVTNCYNTGTISGSSYVGGVVGYHYMGTLTNSYYLDTCGATVGGTAKTAAQFASGEVAYLLQGEQETHIWGQKIGTEDYPVLGGEKVLFDQENNRYFNETGILGDLDGDGDVDAYDLTALARHVGGIELLTGQVLLNADVDGDNDVDAYDLTKHARYVGGIITEWDQE